MYQWLIDNEATPYIMVNTLVGGSDIPKEYVGEDGTIILCISKTATWGLDIGNEYVSFGARFKGEPHNIKVYVNAITAIYDKETGQGLLVGKAIPPEEKPKPESKLEKPYLRLVVNNDES